MNTGGAPGEAAISSFKHGLRRSFVLAATFSLAVNLLMLTVPLYMLQIFDRVLMSRSEHTLVLLTVMAAGALVAMGMLDAARGHALSRLGAWSERRMGAEIYTASVNRALATGRSSAQGLRDLMQVRSFLSGPALIPPMDIPWTPIFVAVIFLLHPLLGLFAFAGAVILFLTAIINEMVTRPLQSEATEAAIANTNAAEKGIRNADAITAMGMLPNLIRRWEEEGAQGARLSRKVAARASALTAMSRSFRLLLQMGILGLGALLVVRGEITAGAMIAGSILLGRALAPVEMAVGSWRQAVQGMAAWKRVRTLLESLPAGAETIVLPAPKGQLGANNITYFYPGQADPVLRGVTFRLQAGETMAILGPSAAGKTTLARVLVGNLKPRMGAVRLDGADLSEYAPEARMRDIGYLPQDIELFPGSVRDNIARMGKGDDAEVVAAAKLAGAHAMVLSLPQGYGTPVGEGGVQLSGGQRQIIGLARALYGMPRLVVLDEPNANLDQSGDAALIRALDVLKSRGATVIVISHRTSIVRHVDQVMVLKGGQVETIGPPRQALPKLIRPEPEKVPAAAD